MSASQFSVEAAAIRSFLRRHRATHRRLCPEAGCHARGDYVMRMFRALYGRSPQRQIAWLAAQVRDEGKAAA